MRECNANKLIIDSVHVRTNPIYGDDFVTNSNTAGVGSAVTNKMHIHRMH